MIIKRTEKSHPNEFNSICFLPAPWLGVSKKKLEGSFNTLYQMHIFYGKVYASSILFGVLVGKSTLHELLWCFYVYFALFFSSFAI